MLVHKAAAMENTSGQPALIYFHGGGVTLRAQDQAKMMVYYVRSGVVVFNIDYRLAPEHKVPAGIMDGVAAVLYIRWHAGELVLTQRVLL